MKKIFNLLFAAFMLLSFAANAQTVENNGVFSHMNIGVKGGAAYSNINTIKDFSFDALNYNAAIEIGKDVTPITGLSLEGICTPKFANEFGISRTDLFGNVKFNLMNLFGGYNGMPRCVEVKTVTGIGWNHNFRPTNNPNDIALQGGFEFDFNLGKYRNWYITFTPTLQANEILQSEQILYAFRNADVKATLGVAYRLGSGEGSHNFIIPEQSVNESDYNELVNKYNELLNQKPEVDTVVVEKVVQEVVEKVVVKPADLYVNFSIGSANISDENMRTLTSFATLVKENGCEVKVTGSADTSTGSRYLNEKLAQERASNVANALTNLGVKVISIESALDVNGSGEASRCTIAVAE